MLLCYIIYILPKYVEHIIAIIKTTLIKICLSNLFGIQITKLPKKFRMNFLIVQIG